MPSEQRAPIIIIGMHRSGTSLICRLLEKLGLFCGVRKDPNNESFFFMRLNTWILRACSAGWDNPEPVRFLYSNPELVDILAHRVKRMVYRPRVAGYMGVVNYLRYGRPGTMGRAWGWKDPCNTITLDLWMKIFPNSRIVSIKRHGLDVACSLKARNEQSLESLKRANRFLFGIYLHAISPRVSFLEEGVGLWKEYNRSTVEAQEKYGDRVHNIRFESLVADPETILGKAAEFCGLAAAPGLVRQVCQTVSPGRAYFYKSRPDNEELARRFQSDLAEYGY